MAAAEQAASAPTSVDVRDGLTEALELDLVGPWPGHSLSDELLPGWQRPSNWYLTGFLIPSSTPPSDSSDDDADDEMEEIQHQADWSKRNPRNRNQQRRASGPLRSG